MIQQYRTLHGLMLASALSTPLLFWRRGNDDDIRREAVFAAAYDILADLYETTATLKPEWSANWEARRTIELPPRYDGNTILPDRTIQAIQETRFARMLLQRHRWRSVRQPLFESVDPIAWAAVQRTMQVTPARLLGMEEEHAGAIYSEEVDWISRAVEGFDNARTYLRSAERAGEPVERQVSNAAYVSIHLSLQLSDRFIQRQSFELLKDV